MRNGDSETHVRRKGRIAVWLLAAFAASVLAAALLHAGEAEAQPPITLAVLNFANRNPGDGWDWLQKGLADMLITDLSKAGRLQLVERDRMQLILGELTLVENGIGSSEAAARTGKVARADWVLFGSFLRNGPDLTIEAHIVGVNKGELVEIELVEGKTIELFALEKRLARALLERLSVPVTEKESHAIDRLPADSIPAFEHYARGLDHFDGGRWFEALCEYRLAVRASPEFPSAEARLADLYRELREPRHALAVYRGLVARDQDNALPEDVYYRMGRMLEDAFQDRAQALAAYERILSRYPEYEQPFDIRQPSRPSRWFDDVGGEANARAIAAKHDISLRALQRLAIFHREKGEDLEAARRYSQIVRLYSTHGMGLGPPPPYFGLYERVVDEYRPIHYRFVCENRDADLYPPLCVYLVPPEGVTAGPETQPTHGYYKRWCIWLASPGKEFATVTLSADCDKPRSAGPVTAEWRESDGTEYRDEMKGPLHGRVAWKDLQGKGWQSARFELGPGKREIKTYCHNAADWRASFTLRPFSGVAVSPRAAAPTSPAGTLAAAGSNTCLMADRAGTIWLLWDNAIKSGWGDSSPTQESDLFCATSKDGEEWAPPQALPVSSAALDMCPIIQQTRNGVYWVVWLSDRDPANPKWFWIASSQDGIRWSFPRQVVLPIEDKDDVTRWRTLDVPSFAFAIDANDTFWLLWQGRLFRSEDATRWVQDQVLSTQPGGSDNYWVGTRYFLTHDAAGRLLLLASGVRDSESPETPRICLLRSKGQGGWQRLGFPSSHFAASGALCRGRQGEIATVFCVGADLGVFLRTCRSEGEWSESVELQSNHRRSFHPAIAPLPDGRYVVAFGSQDGISTVVCGQPSPRKPGE